MKPPSKKHILLLAAAGGFLAAAIPASAYDYDYPPGGYDPGWESRHHHRSAGGYYRYDRTVAWAQSILNSLGYWCGRPDGIMGPRTQHALIRYQCDHDLPHSGCIDGPTMQMLSEE